MITASEDHAMRKPDPASLADRTQIDAYLTHLKAGGHPATTIKTYRSPLLRAARELPNGLCAEAHEIATWLSGLGLARNTLASYQVALRGFYAWAIRTGRLVAATDPTTGQPIGTADPMTDVPPISPRRGLPRPVPLPQLGALLAAAPEPYRLWCKIAAYAGARCCEIARLTRADVTEQVMYLNGKGDRERLVPVHPELWAVLRDLPAGPVARDRRGHAVIPRTISDSIARLCDRLGYADITAHRLRHTAGTVWYQATGDVRATQQLLGHASPTTTQIYTAVSDVALRAAVLAMPTLSDSSADDAGQG